MEGRGSSPHLELISNRSLEQLGTVFDVISKGLRCCSYSKPFSGKEYRCLHILISWPRNWATWLSIKWSFLKTAAPSPILFFGFWGMAFLFSLCTQLPPKFWAWSFYRSPSPWRPLSILPSLQFSQNSDLLKAATAGGSPHYQGKQKMEISQGGIWGPTSLSLLEIQQCSNDSYPWCFPGRLQEGNRESHEGLWANAPQLTALPTR